MAIPWNMMVPSIVFTRIKTQFSEQLKTRYNMTEQNFSSVSSNNKHAVFPFVYVQMLTPVEKGQTLDGLDINAGMFTFQIDVVDNQSQQRAREVMGEVQNIMKSMRFSGDNLPSFEDSQNNVHRSTARFKRMIGALDTL